MEVKPLSMADNTTSSGVLFPSQKIVCVCKLDFILLPHYAIKIRYIKGIVITDNVWEIMVIDAPVSVSPPYAAG